jgi:hypothetical protein
MAKSCAWNALDSYQSFPKPWIDVVVRVISDEKNVRYLKTHGVIDKTHQTWQWRDSASECVIDGVVTHWIKQPKSSGGML